MARDGYLILDSDLHMMEPDDLWARYLEGPHRASPPRFFGGQQRKLAEGAEDQGHAAVPHLAQDDDAAAVDALPEFQHQGHHRMGAKIG